ERLQGTPGHVPLDVAVVVVLSVLLEVPGVAFDVVGRVLPSGHLALDVLGPLLGHDLLLSAGRSLLDRQLPVPGWSPVGAGPAVGHSTEPTVNRPTPGQGRPAGAPDRGGG